VSSEPFDASFESFFVVGSFDLGAAAAALPVFVESRNNVWNEIKIEESFIFQCFML